MEHKPRHMLFTQDAADLGGEPLNQKSVEQLFNNAKAKTNTPTQKDVRSKISDADASQSS